MEQVFKNLHVPVEFDYINQFDSSKDDHMYNNNEVRL